MKVVITKDDDGYTAIWPIEALERLQTYDGDWDSDAHTRIVQFEDFHSCSRGVCKLLGFTPRKSSKQVVDITVKRLKK